MNPRISEQSFEEAIEAGLVRYGPDARPWDGVPGVEETPYGEGPPRAAFGGGSRRTTIAPSV